MNDPWAAFPQADADPWAAFPVADKPMSAAENAVDAYKGLGTGVIEGTEQAIGGIGDLRDLAKAGVKYAANKAGIDPAVLHRLKTLATSAGEVAAPAITLPLEYAPTSQDVQNSVKSVAGKPYEPQGDYGKAAKEVGSFIPTAVASAFTGGEALAPRVASNLVRYAAIPGVTSYEAEKYLPEGEYKPYEKAALTLASTLINPSHAITPFPASEARQDAVNTLRNEGVTSLTAGQKTGNERLQYMESMAGQMPFGGNRAHEIEAQGQNQFTEAATRRAGTGPNASPEVLAANQRRLGQAFDDLSARNNLIPDNQFINDIVDAASDYRRVPDSQQRQMVQGYIDDIIGHVNNGQMPGADYQEMRSRLSRQSNSLRQSDPTLSQALRDMRNALDSGMRRSMPPGSPDAELWDQTRAQYGAQKVLENAASRAGAATAEGQITPANLRNVVSAQNRGAYARGEGPFNELARAGVQAMTPLPNSGTAHRLNALDLLDVGKSLLKLPGGLAARAITSVPGQAYLSNQLMNGSLPASPAARRALMVELLLKNQKQIAAPNDQ